MKKPTVLEVGQGTYCLPLYAPLLTATLLRNHHLIWQTRAASRSAPSSATLASVFVAIIIITNMPVIITLVSSAQNSSVTARRTRAAEGSCSNSHDSGQPPRKPPAPPHMHHCQHDARQKQPPRLPRTSRIPKKKCHSILANVALPS